MVVITLIIALLGCSKTTELAQPDTEPVTLEVVDLTRILENLDPAGATLYYYGESENSCSADSAIRASYYIEQLRSYTWDSFQSPEERGESTGYRYIFEGVGVTITAYQTGTGDFIPVHAVTATGDGWFALSYLEDEHGLLRQAGWMAYDTFAAWFAEARAAETYRGEGTPLSAEELGDFQTYTASIASELDEETGAYSSAATAVSCFFSSEYDDPRNLEAGAFLAYCPAQGDLAPGNADDESEFWLVQEKLDWRGGEDSHLLSLAEMPIPCHRLPKAYVEDILMQYAGIRLEDMHTDWESEALYISETECFYTFTSDFGPGVFNPLYGEKSGEVVTLWSAAHVLKLQRAGDTWHILSYQAGR